MTNDSPALSEQLAYYRARAAEYADWWRFTLSRTDTCFLYGSGSIA